MHPIRTRLPPYSKYSWPNNWHISEVQGFRSKTLLFMTLNLSTLKTSGLWKLSRQQLIIIKQCYLEIEWPQGHSHGILRPVQHNFHDIFYPLRRKGKQLRNKILILDPPKNLAKNLLSDLFLGNSSNPLFGDTTTLQVDGNVSQNYAAYSSSPQLRYQTSHH